MGILARLGLRATEQATPSAPPAGQRAFYAKTTGWYDLDSAGNELALTREPTRPRPSQSRADKMVYFGASLTGLAGLSGGAETLHDTSDYAIGSESAKVVTPVNSGTACGFAVFSGATLPDFTDHDVVLWLKITGMANTIDFKFWLGGTSLTNAYVWSLSEAGTSFPFLRDGAWYRITLPLGAATINGTAPDPTTLNSFQIKIYDNGTNPITLQFGGFGYTPRQTTFPRGVVTLRFDDLFASTLTKAAPYMAKYGFRATSYVIAETLWNNGSFTGYANLTDAHRLEDQYGWEHSSHAYLAAVHNQTSSQGGTGTTGYMAYPAAKQLADMKACRDYLLSQGFRAPEQFAWPQGAWDETARQNAAKVFTSIMTLAHAHDETIPVADPTRIRVYAPPNTVTGAQLTAEVDKAIAGGEWLIILFHNIIDTVVAATDIATAAFNTLIDYLDTNSVPVRLASEVLAISTVRQPPVIETFTLSVMGTLTVATGKSRIYLENSYQIETVRVAVSTAPTGAAILVDVNKNGTTVYTTQSARPSIAISGFNATGNFPAVKTFVAGDYLTVDVDQIGSTVAGADLTVTVRLRRIG